MAVEVDACGAPQEPERPAKAKQEQVRMIAEHLRGYYSADSFLAALAEARSLTLDGEIEHAQFWDLVAEELRQIEARARQEAK